MRPLRISIKNFMAFAEADANFADVRIACLMGDNGAGKSSLLDSITWALWGKARGKRESDVIRLSEDRAEVGLEFEFEGQVYRVVRWRARKGSPSSGVTLEPPQSDETTAKAVQRDINALLGTDYDTFVNTAFLRQGDAGAFAMMPPAKRKEALADILALDVWAIFEADAKREARQHEMRLQSNNDAIERILPIVYDRPATEQGLAEASSREQELKAQLAEYNELKEAHSTLSQNIAVAEHNLAIATMRRAAHKQTRIEKVVELEGLEDSLEEYRQLVERKEEIEQGYATLLDAREAYREQNNVMRSHYQLVSDLRDAKVRIADEEARLNRALAALKAKLAKVKGVCTECGQELPPDQRIADREDDILADIARVTNEYKRGRGITEMRDQVLKLTFELDKSTWDADAHKELEQQGKKWSHYDGLHTELVSAVRMHEKLQSQIDRERSSIAELDSEFAPLQAQVDEKQARFRELHQERKELDAAMSAFDADLDELYTQARVSRKAYEVQLERIEDEEDRLERLQADNGALERTIKAYDWLQSAFGRNGIPTMVINTAIDDMRREANDVLSKLTDSALTIDIRTTRTLASGNAADTLDIIISDNLGERDYSLYSGGEAYRINIALRVALAKILARRSGAQLKSLFIDEGFGSQDEEGKERLSDAIHRISEDFDLILVVTHIADLRDRFEHHLTVTKHADGSRIGG